MKALFPLFEVGLELEFFLVHGLNILNAQDVVAKELGFSIDQRGEGLVRVNDKLVLRTDGTCMEIQLFEPYSYGHVPIVPWDIINKIPWLCKFNRCFYPYLMEGEKVYGIETVHFIEPGKVFASNKEIINAYTNERHWGKKEGDKAVTIRTAGLHLHFSVIPGSLGEYHPGDKTKAFNEQVMGSFIHTNELIKLADKAFNTVFCNSTNAAIETRSQKRIDAFQKWGDYRVKRDTITGSPTLEYRQPDASMESVSRLNQFNSIFQHLAVEYVNSIP